MDPAYYLVAVPLWTHYGTFCAVISSSVYGDDDGTQRLGELNEIIACKVFRMMLTHGKSSVKIHSSYYILFVFLPYGINT